MVSCDAHSQMKEKGDIFVKQLFKSLQSGDKNEFLKLMPDYEVYKKIIFPFDSANQVKKRATDIRIMSKEEYEQGINREMVTYFTDYLKEGESNGFNWKEAKLIHFSIEISKIGTQPLEVISLNGKLELTFGNKECTVVFEDAMWAKTDWVGIGLIAQPIIK